MAIAPYAAQREAICDACEFKEHKSLLGINLYVCSVCQCGLAAKQALPMATCPKDKWPKREPLNG